MRSADRANPYKHTPSGRHPMFEFVLFLVVFVFLFMIIVIIFAPLSLPPPRSLVSSLPRQLDIEMSVWFFELCVADSSCLHLLPSVWSCRAVLLSVHHLGIS